MAGLSKFSLIPTTDSLSFLPTQTAEISIFLSLLLRRRGSVLAKLRCFFLLPLLRQRAAFLPNCPRKIFKGQTSPVTTYNTASGNFANSGQKKNGQGRSLVRYTKCSQFLSCIHHFVAVKYLIDSYMTAAIWLKRQIAVIFLDCSR